MSISERNISVRLFVCQCLCSFLGLPADKRETDQQPGNTQTFPAIFSDDPAYQWCHCP